MRFWPFGERETREVDYTDVLIAQAVATAQGETAAGLSAALETASGYWQRAWASAELSPGGPVADAIRPYLGFIGRSLVRGGEVIFYLDTQGGEFELIPACSCSITGDPSPSTWTYEVNLPGPSTTVTRTVGADRILHLFYARADSTPWKGIGPVQASATTRKLLDNLEIRLAQEAGGAVGTLIPVPSVRSSDKLQGDIRALKGQPTLVESMAQAWDRGSTGAPAGDYKTVRIGASPPEVLAKLRREAEESILAACGINPSVLAHSDGTLLRESFRQFVFAVISPTAQEVAAQVGDRFDLPGFRFSFDRLAAADVTGRARAVGSLVQAGVSLAEAMQFAGFEE